jgi:LytS/YehU family sensor histidine kinase
MLISIIDPRYISGLILNPMIAVTVIFIPLLAVLNHQHLDKPSKTYVYIWSIFIVVVLLRAIFFSFAIQGPPKLMHFFHTGYNQHYLLVFVALFTSMAIGFRVRKIQIESNAAMLEASTLRQKTLELQLSNLQARIQPHFLYNILNTIANLVFVDAKKAEKAIVELSTFYRSILKHVMCNTITLDKEVDIVIRYLYLEKIRFGKRLSYSISFDKECQNVKIPAMSIQVLVENSLKHGIHPKINGGTVNVTVKKIGDRCEMIVADTGIGLNNIKNSNGTGLKTLHDRLNLVFAGDFLFEIENILQNNDTTGVIATINIPCSSKITDN